MALTMDDLPIELLILIFAKGCEDEGFVSRTYDKFSLEDDSEVHAIRRLHEAHPRRLKAFASTVRLVCSCWKYAIGLDRPSSDHFWVARFSIMPPGKHRSHGWGTEILGWTRQLIKFWDQLRGTRGCSVFIHFSWWDAFEWEEYEASYPSGALHVMRLFCRLIDYLPTSCSQITSISMYLHEPRILRHILEVLPRLTAARALSEILFYPNSFQMNGFPVSSAVSPESPTYKSVLSDYRTSASPLQLTHLSNVDSLLVPNAGWLHELELGMHIQRLIIDDRFDIPLSEVMDALRANNWDCLVHLQIRCDKASEEPLSRSSVWDLPMRKVDLPRVKSLHLMASDLWTANFLRYLSFPSLEMATVIVNGQEEPYGYANEAWSTMGPNVNALMMHLGILSISVPFFSFPSLATFDYFTNSAIQTLRVVFSEWALSEDEVATTADSFLFQFAVSLSHLSPKILQVEGPWNSVTDVHFLAHNLSTRMLEILIVNRNDPLPYVWRNQHARQPDGACDFPVLQVLQWHSGLKPRGVAEFLHLLGAPVLEKCLFNLSDAFSDSASCNNFPSNTPVNSFPSVTQLTLTLDLKEFPEARSFWETFPNVRSFILYLSGRWWSLDAYPPGLFYQMIESVIQSLLPTGAAIPFRNLHHFTFTIAQNPKLGEKLDTKVAALLEAVFDVREQAGAEAIKVEFLDSIDVSG